MGSRKLWKVGEQGDVLNIISVHTKWTDRGEGRGRHGWMVRQRPREVLQ